MLIAIPILPYQLDTNTLGIDFSSPIGMMIMIIFGSFPLYIFFAIWRAIFELWIEDRKRVIVERLNKKLQNNPHFKKHNYKE